MASSIWMAISPDRDETRVLVREGLKTILKARLSPMPGHPRALQWLIEAVALWQDRRVRAVLCVGGLDQDYAEAFCRNGFADFGGPLYSLQWVEGLRMGDRALRRDELDGLGRFDDLTRLHVHDVLEREER